jgi:hypothetical protein
VPEDVPLEFVELPLLELVDPVALREPEAEPEYVESVELLLDGLVLLLVLLDGDELLVLLDGDELLVLP